MMIIAFDVLILPQQKYPLIITHISYSQNTVFEP